MEGSEAMEITNPIEKLIECHDQILTQLSLFDRSLSAVEKHGVVGLTSEKKNIGETFEFIETTIALHTRDEEDGLFPTLQGKLQARSEGEANTPVDVMESEHRTVEEVTTRIKRIVPMIEENPSSEDTPLLLDEFLKKGHWLIQAYQRHIWKENNILFPMADQLLSVEEKEHVAAVMNSNRTNLVRM
jgi:regulator of cell morphogenesis and NO signaling